MQLAEEKLPCQKARGSQLLEHVPYSPFFCFSFLTACVWTVLLLLLLVVRSDKETTLFCWVSRECKETLH